VGGVEGNGQIIENYKPEATIPPKWDDMAAERIVDVLIAEKL